MKKLDGNFINYYYYYYYIILIFIHYYCFSKCILVVASCYKFYFWDRVTRLLNTIY